MEILIHPNEELRKVSSDIIVFDDILKSLVERMTEQTYQENGIGLAAPQVGIFKRLILVDPSGGDDASQFLPMVNPRIISMEGKSLSIEGCLSIPGVSGEVERAAQIEVEYQTLTGEKQSRKAGGLLATVIQHEVDHLDGILFIDRISGIRKLTLKKAG